MERETPIHFTTNFSRSTYRIDTCIGAICMAFEHKGWEIDRLSSVPVLTGYFNHHGVEAYRVQVTIKPGVNRTLAITLTCYDDFVTIAYLEQYAATLIADTERYLQKIPVVALQSIYKRQLQKSDIQFLRQKGMRPSLRDGSVFGWVYGLFFTAHPMQFPAWVIVLNAVYFAIMVIDGTGLFNSDIYKLIKWGAINKELVLDGQYWRLFTACFVHAGLWHLVSNMIGLLMASAFLMVIINRWQFLTGYLVSGLVGFAASIWWHNDIITNGASGAVFGCFGMLIGLTITPLLSTRERVTIAVFLILYVGLTLVGSLSAGVDAAAHLGGLLAGVAIGVIYYFDLTWQRSKVLQPVLYVLVIGVGLINCAVLLQSSELNLPRFDRLERKYTRLESEGMLYYTTPNTSSDMEVFLLRQSIPRFEGALQVADSMRNEAGIREGQKLYADRLYQYTQYRLTALRLRLRVYNENSGVWNDSIIGLEKRVDSLLGVFHAN